VNSDTVFNLIVRVLYFFKPKTKRFLISEKGADAAVIDG